MYGTAHTNKGKYYLQLTTSDDRVPELVNYINKRIPWTYDYPPAPDITVEPIQAGNDAFIGWVKK